MRPLAWLMLLLVALSGCARPSQPPTAERLPEGWPSDPDQVVFQVYAQGGYVGPMDHEAQVPELTLLSGGKVIGSRQQPDGTIRFYQGQASTEAMAAFYRQAAEQFKNLEPSYTAAPVTDMPTTWFTLWRDEGLQRVEVYAFTFTPMEWEEAPAVTQGLRSLMAQVQNSAEGAEPYLPDQALLLSEPYERNPTPAPPVPWSGDLPSIPQVPDGEHHAARKVEGETARHLLAQVPYHSPHLYLFGEQLYRVRAVPAVPTLPH